MPSAGFGLGFCVPASLQFEGQEKLFERFGAKSLVLYSRKPLFKTKPTDRLWTLGPDVLM